jgi:hypothetical protein
MAHPAVPLGTAHARPQAPQWLGVLVVLTSQPLAALPSQSANPAAQVKPQRPAAQAGVALSAPMHTVPQAPQWETLVPVLVSQPLAALPSQSPKPAAHIATAHWPIVQAAVALARSHRVVHAPQRLVSVLRLTSQPLRGSLSQSAKGAVQRPTAHTPSRHAAWALATSQRLPQAPHDAMLDRVSRHALSQHV